MSSFVIDKVEYMKAAGLLYGFESEKRDSHKWYLDHLKEQFQRCYELNVASVNDQYGDNEKVDECDYNKIFEAYKDFGRKCYNTKRKEFVYSMLMFFRSVNYQIENKEANKEVTAWLYTCIMHLEERYVEGAAEWWGEINLEDLGFEKEMSDEETNVKFLTVNSVTCNQMDDGRWELETYTDAGGDMVIVIDDMTKRSLVEYLNDFDINEEVLKWWPNGQPGNGLPFDNVKDHYNDIEEWRDKMLEIVNVMPY